MEDFFLYLLAIGAGLLAGFINTLAGSGSLVTLPMLIFLGLPPTVANGSNRIGVLVASVVGLTKFKRSGKLDLKNSQYLLIPSLLGAVIGALIAIDLNQEVMRYSIAVMMSVMLVVILLKPQKWLREKTELMPEMKGVVNFIIFFAIGIYGGFIQAGVGIFLLAGMVLRCGFSMVHSNGIKLFVNLIFNVPVILIFIYNDQIDWVLGGIVAVGQAAGAWLAAHFASNSDNAAIWMRRLLLTIITLSILKFLGALDFLLSL